MSGSAEVRRATWRSGFAWAAAALDAAALVASFLPVGARSCTGYTQAVGPGQPPAPYHEVCRSAATIGAFGSPEALLWLSIIVVLGLVPLATLHGRWRVLCAVSAVLQFVLQYIAMGAFLFWLPVLLCTIAAAIAPTGFRNRTT